MRRGRDGGRGERKEKRNTLNIFPFSRAVGGVYKGMREDALHSSRMRHTGQSEILYTYIYIYMYVFIDLYVYIGYCRFSSSIT